MRMTMGGATPLPSASGSRLSARLLASTVLMATISHAAMAAPGDEIIDGGEVRDITSSTSYGRELIVGSSGNGTLNIKDGATLTNANEGTIGFQTGSNGKVTVDGPGSSWINGPGRELSIGWSGTGELTITNGGSVSNSNGFIGARANGSGTVTVSGAGSTWTNTSQLILGFGTSTGKLTIENGGTVTNSNGRIGLSANSTGTVTVTGTGSTLTDSGSLLLVGYEGNGTLNIAEGGLVTVGTETGGVYDGTLSIAYSAGSTGALNIGAGAGESATSAGTLKAGKVVFGEGDGSLVFNHTETGYVFGAALSGDGTIDVVAGTTSLTGDASQFTGSADISSGAGLTIGASTDFGGSIANDGELTFADTNDFTFANKVSGTGSLTKSGTGTLTLTGDSSSFTGATTIANGGLKVTGSLAGSVVTARSGSTLSGSGTVGGIVAQAGSTVAPGDTPGTLTVNGTYEAQSGSTYAVELEPGTTTSNKIVVNGTATIRNGATLKATSYGTGSFVPNARYTVLTATGGVTGEYTLDDTAISAFYGLRDEYDANNVYLDVAQTRAFTAAARTRNQRGTASGLQSLPTGNGLRSVIETMPDDATARDAFDQLSGEMHASLQGRFMAGAGMDRGAINQRLVNAMDAVGGDAGQGGQVSMGFHGAGEVPALTQVNAQMWGKTFGGWGETDATSETARVTSYGGGMLLGFDAEIFQGWRTGIMAGYSRSRFQSRANNSSGTADSFHSGVYAGTQVGNFGLRMGAGYTFHALDTSRTVGIAGFSDTLTADYSASTAQVFAEAGYAVHMDAVALEPFAGIAGINQHTDGFTETGGAAALTARSSDSLMGVSTLGLRGETIIGQFDGITAALNGSLAWRHAFGDIDPAATMRFASGSDAFSIAGTPIDRDTALFEAGLSLQKGDTLALGLTYQGEAGATAQNHTGQLSLMYRF